MANRKPKAVETSPLSNKRQVNINLTPEGRQCLEELTVILDLSASAVINQALRAWRLSEEIVGIDQRKQHVLGLDPARAEVARAKKKNSQTICEDNSLTPRDPRT